MKKKLLISKLALWAAVYTVNAQTSITESLSEVNLISGTSGSTSAQYEIVQDYTFPSEVILEGTTFVASGVTLTINPGTIVRGQPVENQGDIPGSLCVSRGGQIDAQGTVTNPIIFTTAADTNRGRWTSGETFLDSDPADEPLPPFSDFNGTDTPNAGLWGAVTLLGYAPINRGPASTGVAGEEFIEGFNLQEERTTYGGILPNDSSGILRYVSIRHSGVTIVSGDEQQGLTLGGIGAGTLLENIDIYCSADDGIEIFGGTANLRNVIISYVNDDGFDLDQGWTGNVQNLFVLASNLTSSDDLDLITSASVAEWDGEDGPSDGSVDLNDILTLTGQPFTAPTMYNVTMFADGVSPDPAITIDTNFGGNVYNSIFFELEAGDFVVTDNGSGNPEDAGFGFNGVGDRLANGTFNVNGVSFVGKTGVAQADVGATSLADGIIANTTAIAKNSTTNTYSTGNPFSFGALTSNVYNSQSTTNGINPVPLTGATSNVMPVVGPFFEAASYRGAFPQSFTQILYTTGWSALNIRGILVDAANGANILQ